MKYLYLVLALILLTTSIYAADLTTLSTSDRNSTIADIDKLIPSTENTKIYDQRTETATIKSPTGTTEYATIKLLTPRINYVSSGYQKVAEFEVNSKITYTDYLSKMYFFDLKNNSIGIKRGFDLRIPRLVRTEEPIYEYKCAKVDDKNGDCILYDEVDTGLTKTIETTEYDLLTEKNFGIETKTLSIWTNVLPNERIEWIPELYGTLIDEWAIWDSSLNSNLKAYYNLNETSGVWALDTNGLDHNALNVGATINQTGKIDKAYLFETNDYASITSLYTSIDNRHVWSGSLWFKTSNSTGELFSVAQIGGSYYMSTLLELSAGKIQISRQNGSSASQSTSTAGTYNDGNWHHVVFGYDGSNMFIQVDNGTRLIRANTYDVTAGRSRIGFDYTTLTSGYIDEVAIFDKNLSTSDTNYLYQLGNGLAYCGAGYPDYWMTSCTLNPTAPTKIDLNVVYAWNKAPATRWILDCNNNTFDNSDANTIHSITAVQNTNIDCNISKTGYATILNQHFFFDSNKTSVYYLNDSTAPSVGQTTTDANTGFKIWGSYIGGTGSIYAPASDAGSGIASCWYRLSNAGAWASADSNATGCYKSGISITNATSYQFDLNAIDNNRNNTAGTATPTYTGDTIAPVTTIEKTTIQDNNNWISVALLCTDSASGCATTNYRIDGGTWYTLDSNKYDYNSTEVESTQAAYKVYQTHYFTKTRNDLNGTATHFVTSITNQLKETSVATTKVKYRLVFMDGTDENTSENTDTGAYSPYTYTVTTTNKDVNYVETLMACDSGTTSCYFKDTNIIYTEDSPWIDYNGLGHQQIEYYSIDNVGNTETTNQSDLNMPVLLTIKYPKNIATLVQLTEKWTLRAIGGVNLNLTDLNTDYNVYVAAGTLTTFHISDVNGNYTQNTYNKTYYADSNNGTTDTLQPYLYALATSLVTTIYTKDAYTSSPVPDITIKIYGNLPGIGNTLIGQVTTDSKGQTLALFIIGQSYIFEIYKEGVLIKTYNITASSSSIYIYIYSAVTDTTPTQTGYNVSYSPTYTGINKASVGTLTLTQTITNVNTSSTTYISSIIQNGVTLDTNTYTSSAGTVTFTFTIDWADINKGTLTSKVVINGRVYQQNYNINDSFGTNYNILTDGLMAGMRSDLGCSATGLCFPLLTIAIILSILLVIWASVMLGQFQTQSAGLIFLISIGLFTYLTWIPIELLAGVILIILAFIVNERRS
jgi:hypothetical protein